MERYKYNDVVITFIGQYVLNKDNELIHTSPKHSIKIFEKDINDY